MVIQVLVEMKGYAVSKQIKRDQASRINRNEDKYILKSNLQTRKRSIRHYENV